MSRLAKLDAEEEPLNSLIKEYAHYLRGLIPFTESDIPYSYMLRFYGFTQSISSHLFNLLDRSELDTIDSEKCPECGQYGYRVIDISSGIDGYGQEVDVTSYKCDNCGYQDIY